LGIFSLLDNYGKDQNKAHDKNAFIQIFGRDRGDWGNFLIYWVFSLYWLFLLYWV